MPNLRAADYSLILVPKPHRGFSSAAAIAAATISNGDAVARLCRFDITFWLFLSAFFTGALRFWPRFRLRLSMTTGALWRFGIDSGSGSTTDDG